MDHQRRTSCFLAPGRPIQAAAQTTAPSLRARQSSGRRRPRAPATQARRIAHWLLLASALATSASFAQTRGGTMKLVATAPPGTAVDVIARSLATSLGTSWLA
jgi:hypothetical protein